MSNVTVLSVTVDVKPVPPANFKTCPVVNVSCVELSSSIVNEPDGIAAKLKLPEPSVFKNSSAPPSALGNVKVVDVVTELGALSPIKLVPFEVPSFNFKLQPVLDELPIKISSIALLLSTSKAELAVKVPCT